MKYAKKPVPPRVWRKPSITKVKPIVKSPFEVHLNTIGIFDPVVINYLSSHKYGLTQYYNSFVACKFDLNSAVVFNYISYWVLKNKDANINYRDSYYWTFNSISRLRCEYFPYLSERSLTLALKKLCHEGVVIKSKKNYNRHSYDKTGWYTINESIVTSIFKCSSKDLLNTSLIPT